MNDLHVEKQLAPYGTWASPITADSIVSDTISLESITTDSGALYWLERRPKEGGRYVLVRQAKDGTIEDITPTGYNVSSRVHEYGGGDYFVDNETVYFSNYTDQRLYKQNIGGQPEPITLESKIQSGLRYADMVIDTKRQRIISVLEDHTKGTHEPSNSLIVISLNGDQAITTIADGHDFFSSPRISPDGGKLAWLSWDHPNMPWEATQLNIADFAADGGLNNQRVIAGGTKESIFQPEWTESGDLLFVSDRSDWWNLYLFKSNDITPLCPMEAEFGQPQWIFGQRTYVLDGKGGIICSFNRGGFWQLGKVDLKSKAFAPIHCKYTDIAYPTLCDNKLVFRGASPSAMPAIVSLDLTSGKAQTIKSASSVPVEPSYLSAPENISFPTSNNLTAHALYYAPHNPNYKGIPPELPPLLVKSHGGPTASLSSALSLEIQFWTSRGIAVVDVNYGGSIGHGREYRNRLNGAWGIVDVDDCTNAALHLAEAGLVDRQRLLIAGRSASGYTTLCALTFKDVFRAGTSTYGISDMVALATDTHKFELHSLDSLIGHYPEQKDIYIARSPLYHAEKINCPMLFLQGLDDKVVPPEQTQLMVEALKSKHIPVACLLFAGERHGFRQATTIKRALEAELYFYSQILGFTPADKIEPVPIENFKTK